MSETFVNKVADSGLVTIDLEKYFSKEPIKLFDLKNFLFMGLILKEKDYRAALLETDFSTYQDAHVAIHCSADAIIPMWANMLAASYLQPFAKTLFFGTEAALAQALLLTSIQKIKGEDYTDQRVVVKGCGEEPIPAAAYVAITNLLRPHVKSIMYGEPCSTVPIYKKK